MTKKKAEPVQAEKGSKEKIDVQAVTLCGNIRDEILGMVKSHTDWKKMPEAKQRDLANGAEQIARDVIRRTANIIAGRGFKAVHGTIKQVVVKDGLKIVVEASGQVEGKHDLIDSQGGSVTLVLADISPYTQNRSEPEIDLDEPPLPLEGKGKK